MYSSKVSKHMVPSLLQGTTTTSAIVSNQDVWLEWCSICETKTIGLMSSGISVYSLRFSETFNPRIR